MPQASPAPVPLHFPDGAVASAMLPWTEDIGGLLLIREGAGPTAPWDGPSFWAAGALASRGVALLFKPSPLLSGATSAAVDPNGRFVAVKFAASKSTPIRWNPLAKVDFDSPELLLKAAVRISKAIAAVDV
ncbi:TPA: hypothetical protein ACH3X1_005409 [Trebouxia sp. C0004]